MLSDQRRLIDPERMVLTTGDVADIRLGFDSLDSSVNGILGMTDIHTLFLGLGYVASSGGGDIVDAFVSAADLQTAAGGRETLNVEETIELFAKFQRFHKGEHRRSHWQNVFAAVIGKEADHITAAHIQELCRTCGGEPDVTLPQAQRILLSIREQAAAATTTAGPSYQREDDDRAAVVMNNKNRWIRLPERHQQATLSEDDFLSLVLQQQ